MARNSKDRDVSWKDKLKHFKVRTQAETFDSLLAEHPVPKDKEPTEAPALSCRKKQIYDSAKEAEAAKLRNQFVYGCWDCGAWHISSD